MVYEWYVRFIGDTSSRIKEGTVDAENLHSAKIKVTKASGTSRWKKRWRQDGNVHYKTDADGRSVGPMTERRFDQILIVQELLE